MSDSQTTAVHHKLDEYIAAYEQMEYFSGTVFVAKEGRILLNKGYGLANIEHHTPNTPQTKFRLASCSKPFTAAAIMLLQQQGLLHVNEPVARYMDGLSNGDQITIHHLLTHSSGLSEPEGVSETYEWELGEVIETFKHKPTLFQPGEQFRYGFSNYAMLAYLIEIVSGIPFERFMHERIFMPSGMMDTSCDVQQSIVHNRASGYIPYENEIVNGKLQNMSLYRGAANLISTAEDLYRWETCLSSRKLLDEGCISRMESALTGNYGYGWYVDEEHFDDRPRKRVYHGGLNDGGFCTRITRYVDDRVFIAVLSNNLLAPQQTINRDIASIVFGHTYIIPQAKPESIYAGAEQYQLYAGQYEAFVPINVTLEEQRLFIFIFGFKIELFPAAEHPSYSEYFAKIAYVNVVFRKDARGYCVRASIRWLGEEYFEAVKLQSK